MTTSPSTGFRSRPRATGGGRLLLPAACVLLTLLSIVLLCQPGQAAAPLDHRPVTPNHPSELAGAGYLLTDPLQGPSQAYWAGAYRTIAGQRSYCLDDFYDYPNPAYGYRTSEVSSWPGRPGSNHGARGRTAQRISWIVNTFGPSSSPGIDAAVSMAINLLTGSQPFLRSWTSAFRSQLWAIDPGIVTLIGRMITDSDRLAGPYTTRVGFGPAPAAGGVGYFTVQVRSARGVSIPAAQFRVTATAGMSLRDPATGRTGATGLAIVRYSAARSGAVSAVVAGQQLPNVTMRLGYSPTHNGSSFRTGSQRVALVSAHRYIAAKPAGGRVTVKPSTVRTAVHGGTTPRPVGTMVTDRVLATGLVPLAGYWLSVTLQDSSGLACGTVIRRVRADGHGRLDVLSAPIATCGGGRDTFTEKVVDVHGRLVVASPPGQPSETFPVAPRASTVVDGGVGPRTVGSLVSDLVRADGLLPETDYTVRVSLRQVHGPVCGSADVTARTDRRGGFLVRTPPLHTCGSGVDTFTEQVRDQHGRLRVSTPAGQPAETFPVTVPPTQPPTHSPTPTPPGPSSPPVRASVPPVPAVRPTPSRPAPPSAQPPSVKRRPVTAGPHLAYTGSAPRTALTVGMSGVLVGGLLLLAGRRRSRGL